MAERILGDQSTKRTATALGRRQVMKADASDIPSLRFEDSEPYTDPRVHYHMSSEVRHYLNLSQWLRNYAGDPAFVVSAAASLNSHPTMLRH
jgi:hypothetical protein